MNSKVKKDKGKHGPEPDRLNIEDMDWREAMRKGLKKKRPKEGWPDIENEVSENDTPKNDSGDR